MVKATYLNSIAYTDFVISEIYKIFKNDEALIIYLSDHADSVYDFENFIGHARDLKSVLEIPFIVFATPKFQEKYPQIWKKIKEVKDLPWVSNGLADFLSDISDINSTWKNPKKSIINAEFNPKSKRMVGKPRADFKTLK